MTEQEVLNGVLEILRDVSERDDITENSCPFSDLGLESIDGQQIAMELEDRFGIELNLRFNPIVDDERGRPRAAKDIATVINDLINH